MDWGHYFDPAEFNLAEVNVRLKPDEQQEAGVDSGLVLQQASGPATLAGVQAGDVLLSINGVPVKSIDQMRATVAKSQKSVALLILHGDSRILVPVDLG